MSLNGLVIAGDRETGEEYLAEIVDGLPHGHDPPPRPIVRVLRVVRYPNQRAIMEQDVATEFPPIGEGTLCRLDVHRAPTAAEKSLLELSAEDALGMALKRAMEDAKSDAERDILRRHADGQYGRKRALLTFHASDIAFLQS